LSAEAIVLIPVAVAAVWLNYLFLSLDQGSDNRYLPKAWRGGPTPPESEGAEPAVSDAPGRASSGHDAAPGPSRPVDVARLTYGTPPTAERVVFAEAELSVLSANAAPTGATLPASRPLLGDAAEQRVLGLLEQRGVLHRVGDRVECANELVRAVLSTPEGIAFLQSPSDSAQFATPLGAVAAAAFRQRDIDGVEFVLVEALRDAPERLGSPR